MSNANGRSASRAARRNTLGEIEAHVGGRPARQRAAEDRDAQLPHEQTGEVADRRRSGTNGTDHRLGGVGLGDETDPRLALRDEAVGKRVQLRPVDVAEPEPLDGDVGFALASPHRA